MMRFRERLMRFMQGRYGGNDELNRFIMLLSFILLIVELIFRTGVLSILFWVLTVFYYVRFLSKNISRRYDENTRFLLLRDKVRGFFRRLKERLKGSGRASSSAARSTEASSDRNHKIFRCPQCGQKVRVPRGRGRICITCPKCSREFIKRS